MAIIDTITLTALIAPTSVTDTYAVTDAKYGKDGLRNVANTTERNAISTERRKQGMIVGVNNLGITEYWTLQPGPWTGTDSDWIRFSLINIIDITKTACDALITSSLLIRGAFYRISGTHLSLYNDGTSSGTTIVLEAVDINKLAFEGKGIFYNPKYDNTVSGYQVWDNKSSWVVSSVTGTFNLNEAVTANNGATGTLFSNILMNKFIVTAGSWAAATSITGNTSGATANISGVVLKTYSVGNKVMWGGYSWVNVSGTLGVKSDILNLSTGWAKNSYTITDYNISIDKISYDYTNDMIIKRSELVSGNSVSCTRETYEYLKVSSYYKTSTAVNPYNPISVFMWGNKFVNSLNVGLGNNNITESYFETVNFLGGTCNNNLLINYSEYFNNTLMSTSYLNNNILENSVISNNFSLNTIIDNKLKNSKYNSNIIGTSGIINGNVSNISDITGNTVISSSISTNILNNNSTISNNYLTGGSNIGYNFLNNSSEISSNKCSSFVISNNSLINISKINLGLSNLQTSNTVQFINGIGGRIENVSLSGATIVFTTYSKTLYKKPDGTSKLTYFNNSDALAIADVTD